MKRCKYILRITAPSGDVTDVRMPSPGVAFAAARGIIRDTHFDAEVHGVYGVATFNNFGGGQVLWNEKSTCSGQTSNFSENTTVAI